MHQFTSIQLVPEPARIGVEVTAYKLGFQEHDIAALIRKGLLHPLGKPQANATKYFARCDIERLAADPQWLDKATRAINQHWRDKNERRHEQPVPRLPARRITKVPASPPRNFPTGQLLSDSKTH